jgi:ribonuclease HI
MQQSALKKVIIHTDGGCHGNPGPGGWAAVLEYGKHRRELSGGAAATTNNRMEIQSALEALTSLKQPCEVELHTDSLYLKKGVTMWLAGWKANGWKTKAKQPVKNADLWRALDAVAAPHSVQWKWVKGHAGHEHNERCDQLANAEIARLRKSHSAAQLAAALAEFIQQSSAAVTSHDVLELDAP